MSRTLLWVAAFLLLAVRTDSSWAQPSSTKNRFERWKEEQERRLITESREQAAKVKDRLESLSDAQKRAYVETAQEYAEKVAGGKNAAYYQELGGALLEISGKGRPVELPQALTEQSNAAAALPSDPAETPPVAAPEIPTKNLTVPHEPQAAPPADDRDLSAGLRADQTWQRNFDRMLEMPADIVLFAFAGAPVKDLAQPDQFRPCVAVGNGQNHFRGSGVLIGPNVVMTAAHVVEFGFKDRIFIGLDVSKPDAGRIVDVKHAVRHPDYAVVPVSVRCGAAIKNYSAARNDIAILILKDAVEIAPFPLATKERLDDHQAGVGVLRGVGYGLARNHDTGFVSFGGLQCTSLLPIGSADAGLHCDPIKEIVAGDGENDMCSGDSGGPLLIEENGTDGTPRFQVAAIVSRGLPCTGACSGGGGVNTLAHAHLDWIRETAAAHGGELATE